MSSTPPTQAGTASTDHEYDPDGLTSAAVTLGRIADLIGMRSGRGDPDMGDKERAARRSDLPPSSRAAMEGELKLLRAQLYASGLFKEIVCVDLGDGGR